MAYDYDKLYGSTPQALGDPSSIFVDFFAHRSATQLRVLDVGCGQGRDAVFIARLGHRVTGVDLSPNGIADLRAIARDEGLAIEAVVADITTFAPNGDFDVILIDRTLHMLPKAAALDVLARLLGCVRNPGWMLIADEKSNMQGFKDVVAAETGTWTTTLDKGGALFLRRD